MEYHSAMADVKQLEQGKILTVEKVDQQEESGMLKEGNLKQQCAEGDMEKPKTKTDNTADLHPAEHGCGDRGLHLDCTAKVGAMEPCKSPEPGRITILKKGQQNGQAEVLKSTGDGLRCRSKEAILVIKLSGGGRTEIRARANGRGRMPPVGLPPKKRERWIPYTTSSRDSVPLDATVGKETNQDKQGGSMGSHPLQPSNKRVENKCWYSSSPLPDGGAMPFRRKKSVTVQPSVSWADDDYWANWDGWKEIIQWGNEVVPKQKEKQKTGGKQQRAKQKKTEAKRSDCVVTA